MSKEAHSHAERQHRQQQHQVHDLKVVMDERDLLEQQCMELELELDRVVAQRDAARATACQIEEELNRAVRSLP